MGGISGSVLDAVGRTVQIDLHVAEPRRVFRVDRTCRIEGVASAHTYALTGMFARSLEGWP